MAFEVQDLQPWWKDLPRNHGYRQEMEKWDLPKRQGGMRPDTPQEFPLMLYKARKRPDGVVDLMASNDAACTERGGLVTPGAAERWSAGNYMEVQDEDQMRKMLGQGWRKTQAEALALFHHEQDEIADVAAHRAYEDRGMSERAKAEAAAYDETGDAEHVPVIPEAKRRPGRPRKDAA